MSIFEALAAPFPPSQVHWRSQTLYGSKALALAYLDARDVMDRLDEVCTPAGWRNTVTETTRGRLIATIEIKVGDDWIGKTDGAGDTDVEGDKGGISDALKRAAVLWGIGRYLYRTPTVWAPCEVKESNGKNYWKAWKPEAFKMFEQALAGVVQDDKPEAAHSALQTEIRGFIHDMSGCGDADELSAFLHSKESQALIRKIKKNKPEWWAGSADMPKDFVPLEKQIERKEYEMAQQIADLARA